MTLGRGRDGLILLLRFQVAVERCNHHTVWQVANQLLLDPANLSGTGQEHQQGAGLIPQGLLNHRRNLVHQAAVAGRRPVMDLHRKRAPLTGNNGHVAQHPCDGCGIQGRGHHQQPQILPQRLLRFPHQGKAKIGLKRALVELVKDDRRIVLQHRVGLDQPGQDALGHHFNAGRGRHLCIQPCAIANRLAWLFTELPGHESGRRPRRQATGLEHKNLAIAAPGRIEEREGNTGGFAGARWGLQEHGTGLLQSCL